MFLLSHNKNLFIPSISMSLRPEKRLGSWEKEANLLLRFEIFPGLVLLVLVTWEELPKGQKGKSGHRTHAHKSFFLTLSCPLSNMNFLEGEIRRQIQYFLPQPHSFPHYHIIF